MSDHRILPSGAILRYTLKERVVHWLAGLSYIYLLLSGLAFWTPWMWWLALFLGGGPVARAVHPWMGADLYLLRDLHVRHLAPG
jgi:cytochrome b subunit of formate dehydrogenase